MKKCETCGKEYVENGKDLSFLPVHLRESFEFSPNCDCFEKRMKKEELDREEEFKMIRLKNKMKKYKKISVVDKKFEEASFEKAEDSKVIQLSKKYAKAIIEKEGENFGLMLYGTVGTGKTYASACIANHLMENGKTVLAISLSQYLSKLRQGWDEAEKELLEAVETCDLLVIDDFGIEKSSEWVEEKIFNLIDKRYRTEKKIVITTNLFFNSEKNECELMKKLDGKGRIRDRIIEMCFPYLVEGESRRKVKTGKEFMDFIK